MLARLQGTIDVAALRFAAARLVLAAACAAFLVLSAPGLASIGAAAATQSAMTDVELFGGPLLGEGGVKPFVLLARNEVEHDRAVGCLAQAVYFEAGYESLEGRRAVAQVVLNRVRDRNFPSSVCGVVYQGGDEGVACQFSFVCDGSLTRRPPDASQWAQARDVAVEALSGHVETSVGAATHYHADYVAPYWRPSVVKVGKVGQHVFYRWRGQAGRAKALRHRYTGERDIPAGAAQALKPYLNAI